MNNRRHIIAVFGICLLLTACATRSVKPQSPVDQPAPQGRVTTPEQLPAPVIAPTATRPADEENRSLPAAVALREQANIATSARDHSRAVGLLERALRISPDDPQTFYDLAANHLALQQAQQALQLARRGLSLNPTNAQRDALQKLIAQSEAML